MIFNFNAVEVFRVAVKIEENGKKFYENALRVIDDPEVKKLFEELAEQEVEHKKRFEDLTARLPAQPQTPDVWFPENEMEAYIKMMADQHVFTSDASLDNALTQLRNRHTCGGCRWSWRAWADELAFHLLFSCIFLRSLRRQAEVTDLIRIRNPAFRAFPILSGQCTRGRPLFMSRHHIHFHIPQ